MNGSFRKMNENLLLWASRWPAAASRAPIATLKRFGSAANLNIDLHGLVLDGVYCTGYKGCARIPRSGGSH
jgi:hypothetical protein